MLRRDYPPDDGVRPERTGIIVGIKPSDPTFAVEVQRAPQSGGLPGTPVSIDQLLPIPLTGISYVDYLPLDGTIYYYRARHIRDYWTAGAWSPWSRAATAKLLTQQSTMTYTGPLMSEAVPAASAAPMQSAMSDGGVGLSGLGLSVASVIGIDGREDRVMNGDFEQGLAYWTAIDTSLLSGASFDTVFPVSASAALAVDTATQYSGTRSVVFSGAGAVFNGLIQSVNPSDAVQEGKLLCFRVKAGDRYRVRAAIKASVGSKVVQLGLAQFDINKTFISFVGVNVTPTTSWAEYEILTAITAGFYACLVVIDNTASAYQISVDDAHAWHQIASADVAPNQAEDSGSPFDNGSKSAAFTIDWNKGRWQKVTLAGAALGITLSNPVSGAVYYLELIQDGTGGRTVTWPAISWDTPDGRAPTLAGNGASRVLVVLTYDASSLVYVGRALVNPAGDKVGVLAVKNLTAITNANKLQYTLPANTLNVDGQVLRVRIVGSKGATTGAPNLLLKFGATTVLTAAMPVGADTFEYAVILRRTGAATQVAIAWGQRLTTLVPARTTPGETLSAGVTISLESSSTDAFDCDALILEVLSA